MAIAISMVGIMRGVLMVTVVIMVTTCSQGRYEKWYDTYKLFHSLSLEIADAIRKVVTMVAIERR